MANTRINVGIGFQIDKTGLNALQNELNKIAVEASLPSNKLNAGLQEAAQTAKVVENALNKAFNVNLGTANISKFNQELKNNNLTIQQVRTNLTKAGMNGANAFNLLGSQILKTNVELKNSNKLLDEMATSMANTVKWGVTSSIFNNISNSIQKAYTYTKNLDSSLNDIRIVTDKSAESMQRFAVQANNAAKGLGASTLDYTQASLIYYQQGLSDEESAARAETTLKAANVTGQTGEEVSEQLTAVWNGYKVTAEETELYVDKLAAVAATTAADLEELSTGMSKVASAANLMGVDIDQLNAQLATIVSVTRQAPESVGTALKTIYARMGDIQAGIDSETTLDNYTAAMAEMGFNVLDMNGNLRDMGEVIEEIGGKWNTMSREQQIALSQTMAGTRQYNNLLSLFDNWNMYTKALETSAEAAGTLQKQQDIYMESTQAHLKELRATLEGVYSNLIDTSELNVALDLLTDLAQVANNFVGSFGGGLSSIAGIGVIVANIFNKQIATGINNALVNHQKLVNNAEKLSLKAQQLESYYSDSDNSQTMTVEQQATGMAYAAEYRKQAEYAKQIQDLQKSMTNEDYQRLTTLQGQIGELEREITLIEQTAILAGEKVDISKEEIEQYYAGSKSIEETLHEKQEEIKAQEKENLLVKEKVQLLQDTLATGKANTNDVRERLSALDIEDEKINEILKNIEIEKATQEDINEIVEKINEISEERVKTSDEELKKLKEQEKVYTHIYETTGKTENAKRQKEDAEEEIEESIAQQKQAANVLETVTAISSTLSSVAMTWMSINSMMSIWSDENASFGEKVIQTLMTMGTLIPVVIDNFNKLNTTLGTGTTIQEIYAASQAKNNAFSALGIKAIFGKEAALVKLIIQQLRSTQAEEAMALADELENVTTAEAIVLLKEENRQLIINNTLKNKNVDEIKNAINVAGSGEGTLKKLGSLITKLKNPYVLAAAAAVAAVAAGIALYTKNQQAKLDAANKEVETSKEIVAQAQEEVNKVKELTSTYEELNKQFENNEITQNEYQLQVYDLCTALGLQSEAVRVLAGDYEGLDEAIRNAEKAANNKLLQDLQAQKDSAAASMTAGAAKGTGTGYDIWKTVRGALSLSTSLIPGSTSNGAFEGFSTNSEYFARGLFDASGFTDISTGLTAQLGDKIEHGLMGITIKAETDEERYQVYEAIIKTLEENAEYANTLFYKQLAEYAANLETGALAYKEAIDSAAQIEFSNLASDKESEILNAKTTEELSKIKRELISAAGQIEGVNPEQAFEMVDEYLASLTDIQDLYQQLSTEDYLISIDPKATRENIEEIIKDLTQEEKNWFYLRFDETKSIEEAKEAVQAVQDALETQQAKKNYDMLGGIIDTFNESDKQGQLTDEQKQIIGANSNYFTARFGSMEDFYALSYQEQKNAITKSYALEAGTIADNKDSGLQDVKNRKEELDNEKDTLSKEISKLEKEQEEERQKQLEAIYELADTGEITAEEANERINAIVEEFSSNATLEEKRQQLAAIEKELIAIGGVSENINDIDLNVTINDAAIEQTKNAVSQVVSEAEKLQSVFEAIGTDSIIDADEIEKIAELYPSLLVGAEKYADGTIKLNSDVVNNFTEGQMEQLTAEKDRQLQSIDAQIKLKEATIKMLYSQLDIAKQVAEGTMTLDEGKGKSQEILGQFIADNSLESYNLADDAAFNSAQNQVDYWNSVTSAAAQAGEAISAAARGETVNFDKIDINRGTKLKEKDLNNYRGHQLEAAESYNAILAEIQQEEKALGELYVARASIASAYDGVTKAKNGGGSGDDRDEALKSIQEEIDRYWELNKTIEKVTDTIEKLNDEQSKLSGKELIASLKEENELLEQQAEAYKALANEQQREANELRGVLSTYGVVFDAQGGVANYLAASQQALNYYNDAVVKYNSHIIDEATFNAAQSSYENFKSQLERYEALYYEEMKDTQDQLDELHTQQLENNLEQWEVGIQLQLDLSEAERNWNDFLQEINEDFKLTYTDISQELSTLLANAQTFTNEEGTFETDIKALKDVMAEIDKFKLDEDSDMFSSMSEAQEKLKELIDTTQGDMSSLYDIFANAWNAYMEGIDQSADKFDDLMGQFENIESELDYQGKLIELIYGEEAYSLLDTLYKAQEKNNYVQIDALKQQRDMWHTLWESAAEGTEEQTKYYELWTQAQDDLNNKVTDYIELLKTDYLNTIDDILKKLETNITGSSLDDLEEEWDRVTESSDKYLDNVESLYEVQTLANKISNSISETSSLKNQQKLQELYDKEIDYLREKENLTKYDLDAANARYEIALKEIALEEAQNSKNSMKLTRGTDGNWSYQYVADQDLVAEKQQDLTDAYKELYDLSKDAYEENLESLTDLQDKYLEAYREIIADETLAAEEKEQKIHELQSYYLEQYNLLAKENALYKDNLAISSSALLLNLYNQDKENFAAMTQEERELVQNLVDANANDFMTLESLILNNYDNIGNQATNVMSKVLDAWSTGAQQIADIWNADDGVSVKAQITEAQNNILDALDTYNYKVEEIAGVVEDNFGPDGITGSIQDAEAATEDLEYAVSNLVDNTIDQLYDYRDALEDIEDMWYSVKDAIMEAIDAAREYANAEAIRKKQSAQTSGSLSSANTSGFASLTPGGGGNNTTSTTTDTETTVKVDNEPRVEVTLLADKNPSSKMGTVTVGKEQEGNFKKKQPEIVNGKLYYSLSGNGYYGYITEADRVKIYKELGFDTGGYTGDWNGGDGKLAFLHSKELVLNAKDTSNILDAVEVIRDISNLSSSVESMIMDKLSAMILRLTNLNTNKSYTSNVSQQDNVENNYYINAEFPNANDVNDIREALLSLSNVASQYRAENKK